MRRPVRRRAWRSHGWLAVAWVAVAWWTAATAQPYAADGGFDRPRRLPDAAHAVLALDAGRAVLVLADGGRVWAVPMDDVGTPLELASSEPVRLLVAAGGPSEPLHAAWAWRDLSTGRYHYAALDDPELFVAPQLLPLVAAEGGRWFTHRGADGGSELVRLDGGGVVTALHRTDLQIAGLSAAAHEGVVHLTWLEGFTEVTAFGSFSAWTAQAARLDADGAWVGPATLGEADGAVARTATAAGPAGVRRSWPGADGVVRHAAAEPDAVPPADAAQAWASVGGRPIGSSAAVAATAADFVARGDAVWRVRPGDDPVAVAWSPVVIHDGAVAVDAAGVHHLAWRGTDVGGGSVRFGSDDRRPMARGWRDRLAAAFGWRPWSLAQEAFGQLAGSLLAAVLASAASLPLLWLAAAFAARGRAAVWRGAAFGALLPSAAVAGAWLLGMEPALLADLVGGPLTLAGAAIGGVALAAVLWRRRDLEPVPAFVAAGVTALGGSIAVVTFVGFQAWLALGWW